MPYLMGGFPDQETATAVAGAYADAGADLIELGVPFSDPLADGPTIHAADTAALAAGATLESVLETCAAVGERIPVALMVYANMVLAQGTAEFARAGRRGRGRGRDRPRPAAGGAGRRSARRSSRAGLALIPLVAPTTPAERRARICADAEGFVYLVSTVGVTGERAAATARAHRSDRGLEGGGERAGRGRLRDLDAGSGGHRRGLADGVIIGTRLVRAVADARRSRRGRRRRRGLPSRDPRARSPDRLSRVQVVLFTVLGALCDGDRLRPRDPGPRVRSALPGRGLHRGAAPRRPPDHRLGHPAVATAFESIPSAGSSRR